MKMIQAAPRNGEARQLRSLRFQRSRVALLLSCLLAYCIVTSPAFSKTSPLAPAPDWGWLEGCKGTFSRAEFLQALDHIYAPEGASAGWVEVGESAARIRTTGDTWVDVPFAESSAMAPGYKRYWRRASELGAAPAGKPLDGLRVAIDPGHLGGEWARMEERFFQLGKTPPVAEGDLTLAVARKVKSALEKYGAIVVLLRKNARPLTRERPKTLLPAAAAEIPSLNNPDKLNRLSELYFYRISEIRARAKLVNEKIRPDVVVCLHFNAEEWSEPEKPVFVPRNHLHALVNGCYGAKELESDDIRADMLSQLFSRVAEEALPMSEVVVETLAEATGLPPYTYFSKNAVRAGDSPYLYARNLLANRLYRAPTLFLEPYVMNSSPVWSRVQLGDYTGLKLVDGDWLPSLVAEYASGVAEGMARYYEQARPKTAK